MAFVCTSTLHGFDVQTLTPLLHLGFWKSVSYTRNGDRDASYTYGWRGQTLHYDFYKDHQKAAGGVEDGRWRVLDTDLSGPGGWPRSPNLAKHPLVLNANLGSATGLFDGGPHWVPDEAWVTLYVEDARGVVTTQQGFKNHKRDAWRGSDCINGTSGIFCTRGFEELVPPASRPKGSISAELAGEIHRLTGSGESDEGRIVDTYWEVISSPLDPRAGNGSSYVSRSSVLEISAESCMTQEVIFYMVDDKNQVGSASYSIQATGSYAECSESDDPRTAI